ncbi:MAG: pyridoxamine 5'-phosphate oxidase [Cyclobacteriaceae bacterium]|nr:pyridoxamine 5'-phosphate oxidase [Cyclobacteriaceae bacterium]
MTHNIADIRNDYIKHVLNIESTSDNPIQQFKEWFDEALKAEVTEVNAMILSTVNKENRPSARVMLLKGIEEGQFIFYTNYQSDKGNQMEENPFVALTFFWPQLERQVRIEGKINKVSPEVSTSYFKSRPKDSQIGALASPQSTPIANRKILEERVTNLTNKYKNKPIERPAQWGGYAVTANQVEFWQGRANRLHDRVQYTLDENSKWTKVRLAP